MAIAEDLLQRVLRQAAAAGATSADIIGVDNTSTVVRVRQGEAERVEQARQKSLGLRIFVGSRSAISSTSDLSEAGLSTLVDVTLANARVTASDPASGLPDAAELASRVPDLDLADPAAAGFTLDIALDQARRVEAAALAYHPSIQQVETSQFSSSDAAVAFATTAGFSGAWRSTRYSLHTVPIASKDGQMVRDWWSTSRRHLGDLDSPEEVGRIAGERTVRRMGAIKPRTADVPVIFDPDTASSLLGHLAGAVNGYSLYKGASFLIGRLGERIASPLVTIVDDGTIPRGPGSKPFDGEGLPTRRNVIVADGLLQSWILDTYSARKLGLQSTGNASRSTGDAPSASPTNLRLIPGTSTHDEIVASVKSGFYVTELIGFGVNLVTGDYSQGAAGFWIQDGKLSHPVHEATIAGHLADMLQSVEMVGDDLREDDRIASPTLKIGRMIVGGE